MGLLFGKQSGIAFVFVLVETTHHLKYFAFNLRVSSSCMRFRWSETAHKSTRVLRTYERDQVTRLFFVPFGRRARVRSPRHVKFIESRALYFVFDCIACSGVGNDRA